MGKTPASSHWKWSEEEMSAQKILGLEKISRSVALWGSAATAIIFVGGFAMDKQLNVSLARLAAANALGINVVLYLGLLVAVLACYLVAVKSQFEVRGSLVAIATVAAVYGWCKLALDVYPGPYLMALAVPPLFHLLAVSFHRFALRSEATVAAPELMPAAA